MRSETWREEVTNGCLLLAAQNFLFFICLKPAPWHLTPQTPHLTFLPVLWICFISLSRQGNVPKKDVRKNTHFRDITHSVWPSCASSKSPQAQSVASGPLVHTMTTYSYKSTLFCKFEHSGVLDCHHYPSLRLKVQSAFHQWKQRPLQHEHQILRSLGLSMLHSISFRLLGWKEWQADSVLQTSIIDSETLAASSNACCSICLGRIEMIIFCRSNASKLLGRRSYNDGHSIFCWWIATKTMKWQIWDG